jgi:hypothetical protein
MRKLFLVLPAFVLLAALAACGGNDKPPLTPDSDADGCGWWRTAARGARKVTAPTGGSPLGQICVS